jgi:hypothetical protein
LLIPFPLVVPWPMPGNLGGLVTFSTFAEWRSLSRKMTLNRLRSPVGLGELEDLPNLALQANPRFLTKRTGELDRVLVTIKLVVLEEPTESIVPFALLRGQRLAFSIESPSFESHRVAGSSRRALARSSRVTLSWI